MAPTGRRWHRLSRQQSRALVTHVPGTCRLLITGILPHAVHEGNNVLEIECGGQLVSRISNRSFFFRKFQRYLALNLCSETNLELKFSLHHEFCPREAGMGLDERALGFTLCSLSFQKVSWPARYWRVMKQDIRYLFSLVLDLVQKMSISLPRQSGSCRVEPPGTGANSCPHNSPGLSIVIFAGSELTELHDCLKSVRAARSVIHEPAEVLVISETRRQKELEKTVSSWAAGLDVKIFEGSNSRRSSTNKALEKCRHDWVYFLESALLLDPASLENVMTWRAPHIFAVGSRMILDQKEKGTIETGWTDWRMAKGRLEFFDRTPVNHTTVRGTLYPHQIGSLFHKSTLLELRRQAGRLPLNYPWDIEWGIRAWKMGRESLFCPMSIIHSANTTCRGGNSSEERTIDPENTLLFLMRNSIFGLNKSQILADLFYEMKWTSLACIFHLSVFGGILRQPFYCYPNLPAFLCVPEIFHAAMDRRNETGYSFRLPICGLSNSPRWGSSYASSDARA